MAQGPDDVAAGERAATDRDAYATNEDTLDGGADAEAIREDIERTRGELGETIDAIQERLSPTAIKERVVEQVQEQFEEAKERVRDATIGKVEDLMSATSDTLTAARRSAVDTIRENPVPAALTAIGVGWLLIKTRTPSAKRARADSTSRGPRFDHAGRLLPQGAQVGMPAVPPTPGLIDKGQRAVGDTVEKARTMVSDVAGSVQETAGSWMDSAHHRARRLGGGIQDAAEESPLAVGAATLAIGAVVGFAIPMTRRENQVMGDARDQMLDQAEDLARSAMNQVREVADRVSEEAEAPSAAVPSAR